MHQQYYVLTGGGRAFAVTFGRDFMQNYTKLTTDLSYLFP